MCFSPAPRWRAWAATILRANPVPHLRFRAPIRSWTSPPCTSRTVVACHGNSHEPGPEIFLANPVYLAVAGEDNLSAIIAGGVPGKLMPPFARSAGGMLTDQQVDILAKGLIATWGKPGVLDGLNPPTYKAMLTPDTGAGEKVFNAICSRCHGSGGEGGDIKGALVDPSFLALISDQNLRSIVIAGMNPDMPNFHEQDEDHPLTDQNVTDVVAWLASHRASASAAVTPAQVPAPTMSHAASSTPKHGSSVAPQEPNQ